jgi:peptidoglycan hydrolase-like protein with peptidoglycan-binding domain
MVKKLQEKLGGLVVDGIFGRKTENAVRLFQINHFLIPDGVVGRKTNEILNL